MCDLLNKCIYFRKEAALHNILTDYSSTSKTNPFSCRKFLRGYGHEYTLNFFSHNFRLYGTFMNNYNMQKYVLIGYDDLSLLKIRNLPVHCVGKLEWCIFLNLLLVELSHCHTA